MKRIVLVLLSAFFISNAVASLKYEKIVGAIGFVGHCSLVKTTSGEEICTKDKKIKAKSEIIINDISGVVASFYSLHASTTLVFGKDKNRYRLAYIWDKKVEGPITLDNLSQHYESYGSTFYANEFMKDSYEIRYFWYEGNKNNKFIKVSNLFTGKHSGLIQFRFSEKMINDVAIYESPGKELLHTVTAEKIKKLRMDKRIMKERSSLFKMKFIIVDFIVFKGEEWIKIDIAPMRRTEISYLKENKDGDSEVKYEDISYNQSIFDDEVIGWIRLYKDNQILMRYEYCKF